VTDAGSRRGRTRRRRRLKKVFAWVRNIGAIVILFAAWQVWGSALVQHHTQTDLARQFTKDIGRTPPDDRPFGLIASTTRVTEPPGGSVIAQIQIPTIGVDQFVVEGTTTGDLERGPGHYRGTAVPGQAGNVALAGHRATFGAPFDRLDQLQPGDRITLSTTSGERLTYVSERPSVVATSDVAVLNDFGDDRLTLTTSTPKYSAAHRLVVVALLVQRSVGAPGGAVTSSSAPQAGPPPGPLTDTETASWNVRRLSLVALLVVLLVLLGLAYRRPSPGRRLLTALILGPIWIGGLYLLFQALTNVLPSTF